MAEASNKYVRESLEETALKPVDVAQDSLEEEELQKEVREQEKLEKQETSQEEQKQLDKVYSAAAMDDSRDGSTVGDNVITEEDIDREQKKAEEAEQQAEREEAKLAEQEKKSEMEEAKEEAEERKEDQLESVAGVGTAVTSDGPAIDDKAEAKLEEEAYREQVAKLQQ